MTSPSSGVVANPIPIPASPVRAAEPQGESSQVGEPSSSKLSNIGPSEAPAEPASSEVAPEAMAQPSRSSQKAPVSASKFKKLGKHELTKMGGFKYNVSVNGKGKKKVSANINLMGLAVPTLGGKAGSLSKMSLRAKVMNHKLGTALSPRQGNSWMACVLTLGTLPLLKRIMRIAIVNVALKALTPIIYAGHMGAGVVCKAVNTLLAPVKAFARSADGKRDAAEKELETIARLAEKFEASCKARFTTRKQIKEGTTTTISYHKHTPPPQ